MFAFNKYDVENLLANGENEIQFDIKPNFFTRLKLSLKGNAINGVQLSSMGSFFLKSFSFMYPVKDLINLAVQRGYRVFVFKRVTEKEWYLKFTSSGI